MSTASPADLPQRGPGLRKQATVEQWATLAKSAVATIHCEPDACDDCKPLDGDRMGLPEAEEKLPVHPNCRCNYTWEWRPGKTLSMTSLRRESERSIKTSTMIEPVTKSAQVVDVVDKTPNNDKDDDDEYLKVPISSTRQDRDGDRFSEDGLRDLRDQIIEQNTPLFGNHGVSDGGGLFSPRYQWQDIIGSQYDAEIEEDGDEEILYSYTKPNPEVEDGERLLRYAKAGMPVGFSVGFRPLEKESNEETGENVFHESDLLETSAVGIQSNRDSVHTDDAAADVLAKGVAAGVAGTGSDFDEETFARAYAYVSELSASGGIGDDTTRGAGDFSEPAERRDHNMGDTPADDGQVTHEQLDKRLEEQRKDLVKDITDAIGDGESEADEADEKDVDDDLQEKVDNLDTSVKELTEKVDDLDPEESETTTAKDPDDEDGTNDETAGDDENETEDPPDEDDDDESKRWI